MEYRPLGHSGFSLVRAKLPAQVSENFRRSLKLLFRGQQFPQLQHRLCPQLAPRPIGDQLAIRRKGFLISSQRSQDPRLFIAHRLPQPSRQRVQRAVRNSS